MSGQKCKEEEKKNIQNAVALVPNGKLHLNSFLQRSQVDSHSIEHSVTLFQKYISFLETASIDWKDSEKTAIINILKHRFEKADPSYLSSDAFENLILSTMADMKKDVNCSFVCIKTLSEELKSYKLKSSTTVPASIPHEASAGSPCSSSVTTARSTPEVICVDTDDEVSTVNSSAIAGHSQSESKRTQLHNRNHCEMKKGIKCHSAMLICSKDVSRSLADGNVQQATTDSCLEKQTIQQALDVNSVNNNALSYDKMKHIEKLEKLLKKIHRKIKKLQKKELTLEEMDEESDYVLEDKLKKKFVKVWEEWCKQVGRSSKAGYETQKPFHYEGSRYKSINVAVEKFMNKKKVFPDFCDILDLVTTENTSSNLCLTETQCHNIARDIFSDVGKTLKERRCRDYLELSGCYLTDAVNLEEDPADHDVKLRLELDHNRKESEMKLDKLLESYVQMQEEKSSVQNSSPDEDNDEDEDICSEADDEEASSCSSDEVKCDEVLPDSLKVKSSTFIAQNVSTKASMQRNLPTQDAKTSSLSGVTYTSSSHISNQSFDSSELSTFQSVKLINSAPTQAAELRNVILTEAALGSINNKKPTSSVPDLSTVTSSQNSSDVSNSLRTSKIKVNSVACGKTSKLKTVSSGDLSHQNDYLSFDTVEKVNSFSDSVVNSAKTSSSVTVFQNSCQNIMNASQCMKSESAANGPSEEIWILSSSDSDASTEPTSDAKTKFAPESGSNSKSIPQQPCSNVSRTRQLGNNNKNFKNVHQSVNSNQLCALKATKRSFSAPIQKQNHIPDKKMCLSTVSKKS